MDTKLNGTWYVARRVPYRREIGLTMKEIKALCIKNNGRLPRVGWEFPVIDQHNKLGNYIIWLQNISGTYVIRQSWYR